MLNNLGCRSPFYVSFKTNILPVANRDNAHLLNNVKAILPPNPVQV